jgi:uncharacterized protein with ATP-grasp and redox domains
LKVEIECTYCIIHRGYLEIMEATKDKTLQFKAMTALLKFLQKEFTQKSIPAHLGTQRDRIIRQVTGNPDPYAERKKISNQKALELLPLARKIIANSSTLEEYFRKACLCSIVGNIIEFDIPGHKFQLNNLESFFTNAERDLAIDRLPEIFQLAKNSRKTLFLCDNAGEIVFDTLLVEALKKLGTNVTVVVKKDPVLNDATLKDSEIAGMHVIANRVTTTGTDSVGLNLKESSKEFLNLYYSADLVIAKGMGYAETLTENKLHAPHALLFRTKCNPVAKFFKVERDKNIATLLPC